MNSEPRGTSTSHAEVTNVSADGFWILWEDGEYFVPFDHYPAFRKAPLEQVFRLELTGPGQFHWPDLDMDIDADALEHPDRYPLIWN